MYKIIFFSFFTNFFCDFIENNQNFYLKSNSNLEEISKKSDFYHNISTIEYSIFNKRYSKDISKLINEFKLVISKDEITKILEILFIKSFDLLSHEEQFFLKELHEIINNSIKRMNFFNSSIFEKMSVSEKLNALDLELLYFEEEKNKKIKNKFFFEEDINFIKNKKIQLLSKKKDDEVLVLFPKTISVKKFIKNIFSSYSAAYKNIYKSLFWYFYLLNKLKQKNLNLPNDDEIIRFFLTIPISLNNIDKNFSKIELYESINEVFNCKTKIGAISIYKEIMPLFLNKEMAKNIIDRRVLFIELINKNDEFREKLEIISNKLSKLINDKKFIEDKEFLENYVQKFIPQKIDYIIEGGRDSSAFYYFIWGLKQQWLGPIHMLLDLQEGIKNVSNLNKILSEPELKNLTKNNSLITNQLINNPYLKQVPLGRIFPKRSLDSLTSSGEKVYTIADAFSEKTSFVHGLSKYSTGFVLDTWKFLDTYSSVKNIIKSSKAIKSYFDFIKELILLSKEAYTIIENFYKENNIEIEMIVPEILNSKEKIFEKNSLLGFLSSWDSGIKEKIKTWFNIIFPGSISRFYLKNIESNYEIFENLGSILGCIDAALTKAKIIQNSEENPNNKRPFSLVKVSDSENSFIEIEKMWFPATNNPISNDFSLNESQRNTFIVSPIAAGKSTTLCTILNLLYFANCGIVPAEKLFYTYYKYIAPSLIEGDYVTGSGTSGHLYEYENFEKINSILNLCEKENENMICFFDEVYKTTNSDDAYLLAEKTFTPILLNKKINTVITTHNPKLLKLTKHNDFKIGIKYIEIIFDKEKKAFIKTFKIKDNDENNWWIKKSEQNQRLKYTEFAYKNKLAPKIKILKPTSFKGDFSFSEFFTL